MCSILIQLKLKIYLYNKGWGRYIHFNGWGSEDEV